MTYVCYIDIPRSVSMRLVKMLVKDFEILRDQGDTFVSYRVRRSHMFFLT